MKNQVSGPPLARTGDAGENSKGDERFHILIETSFPDPTTGGLAQVAHPGLCRVRLVLAVMRSDDVEGMSKEIHHMDLFGSAGCCFGPQFVPTKYCGFCSGRRAAPGSKVHRARIRPRPRSAQPLRHWMARCPCRCPRARQWSRDFLAITRLELFGGKRQI